MANINYGFIMLEITDIKELIAILLFRKGYSMRKLVKKMNEAGYSEMTIGGFSKMLKTKSVKFTKVQEILDFLGYELKVVKKPTRIVDKNEEFTLYHSKTAAKI